MDVRPLILPVAAAFSAILVTLARFDDTVALIAAYAGLGLLALVAVVPSRPLLLFALLPVAAWVAQRPPWAGVIQAIVIAVAVLIILGPLPTFVRSRGAWLPFALGIVGAIVAGFILQYNGLMAGTGSALSLIVLLVAFRAAMIYVAQTHWLYAVAIAACTVPQLGFAGFVIAASELAFGMLAIGADKRHHVALLFGAPFAAVALWL